MESLALGDEVTCVDPATGARVSATLIGIRTAHRESLTLSTDDGTLRCTADHPLFDPDTGTWADAGDWALGKRSALLFVPDSDLDQPRRVEVRARSMAVTLTQVFDLTVDHPLHNFVANGLLVHNKPPPPCLPDAGLVTVQHVACVPDTTCAQNEVVVGVCSVHTVTCGCQQADGGIRYPAGDGGVPDGGSGDGGP